MKLKRLTIEKYRNYENVDLEFNESQLLTSIIGQNAQGKTNILEAIYLLALTKSFRTNKQTDLVKWGEQYCRVNGAFQTKNGDIELEAFYGIPPQPLRSLKKNGVKTSSVKFIGNCQIVFFHPEDLNILYLGPDLRRRYLDILNIQVLPKYYQALRSYKRVLQQRNSLLKRIKEGVASVEDLQIWNEQLVEQGEILIAERKKTIDYINEKISTIYQKMSQSNEDISVEYLCSLHGKSTESPKESFLEALQEVQDRDLQAEFTTVGPHRDDIEFKINGRSLISHASRGEYRSILLSIKILELTFYEDKTNEKPLLLLDDVFSELDTTRQQMLLESIEGYQTILTATHMENMHNERDHAGLTRQKLEVKEGSIM